eukprot:11304951-Heterocapsa_arctica.AAC.1
MAARYVYYPMANSQGVGKLGAAGAFLVLALGILSYRLTFPAHRTPKPTPPRWLPGVPDDEPGRLSSRRELGLAS